jgi:hypothetical protein
MGLYLWPNTPEPWPSCPLLFQTTTNSPPEAVATMGATC